MKAFRLPPLRAAVAGILGLAVSACFIVHQVSVKTMPRTPVTVRTPMRVHLIDGMTVLFRHGAQVTRDSIRGRGVLFSLTLRDSLPVQGIPLNTVLGMEAFADGVNGGATVGYSLLATAVVIGGAVAIACAADPKCFGSCPTIYSDSAGVAVLEAEGFSYSIAPLFEMRDVDRMRLARPDQDVVRLEIRNEALETHYINHIEVLEVTHAAGELVVPDQRGRPLALSGLTDPLRAVDRIGRDVRHTLLAADGEAYRTDPGVLSRANTEDLQDYVELTMPAPAADSAAVVLRLRNSLLTTVLFYDLMLGDRGASAIDYQVEDLQRIGTAVEVGRWYTGNMGMRVAVWRDGEWREAGRFLDTGPVAWKDLAVMVPVPAGANELRVRLSFVADNWRIDRVQMGAVARRPAVRVVPLARVIDSDGRLDTAAAANMRAADTQYLQTQSSQRFIAEFDAGPAPASATRTFLLASQGWYTEWIRQGWITAAGTREPMELGAPAVAEAVRRWRESQESYERQFAATRVPVR